MLRTLFSDRGLNFRVIYKNHKILPLIPLLYNAHTPHVGTPSTYVVQEDTHTNIQKLGTKEFIPSLYPWLTGFTGLGSTIVKRSPNVFGVASESNKTTPDNLIYYSFFTLYSSPVNYPTLLTKTRCQRLK